MVGQGQRAEQTLGRATADSAKVGAPPCYVTTTGLWRFTEEKEGEAPYLHCFILLNSHLNQAPSWTGLDSFSGLFSFDPLFANL